MKRKYIIISLFLFLGITKIFATMRWYYDDKTGCSGYAIANYIGTTKAINPGEFAKECEQLVIKSGATITKYCEKLSKAESFLLWSALEQYDFYQNEIYAVTIQQENQILQLIAVIKDNGNSVDWYGGWYIPCVDS